MSEEAATNLDALTVRDVKTRHYKILDEKLKARFGGDKLSYWPYGDVLAWVTDHGPVAKNSEIQGWAATGKLEVIIPIIAAPRKGVV